MRSTNWTYSGKYLTRRTKFSVEVVHSKNRNYLNPEEPENVWCIYAYIYPDHPKFTTFTSDEIWQEATCSLPLHGGCSFLKRNYNKDAELVSIQVGCDYNHYGDESYLNMSNSDEASSIFYDADTLIKHLEGTDDLCNEIFGNATDE